MREGAMPTNFDLAPPGKTVDGLAAVPIDIQHITAVADRSTARRPPAPATPRSTSSSGPAAAARSSTCARRSRPPGSTARRSRWRRSRTTTSAAAPAPSCASSSRVLAAGSAHTLRVTYTLGTPQASTAGSYQPAMTWSAGPRLRVQLRLHRPRTRTLSRGVDPGEPDLRPVRRSRSSVRIINTADRPHADHQRHRHALGTNHWSIDVPGALHRALAAARGARRPTRVTSQSGTVDAAGIRDDRHDRGVEAGEQHRQPGGADQRHLAAGSPPTRRRRALPARQPLRRVLQRRRHGVRRRHDHVGRRRCGTRPSTAGGPAASSRRARPTAGGTRRGRCSTTTAPTDRAPFDFTEPPVRAVLAQPVARGHRADVVHDRRALLRGRRGAGRASPTCNAHMATFYARAPRAARRRRPTLEEFLVCRSGQRDARRRASTASSTASPIRRRRPTCGSATIRATPAPTPGPARSGIRPTCGSATPTTAARRTRRRSTGRTTGSTPACAIAAPPGRARHFVVTFNVKRFAGTQFVYPGDFLPCIAAAADFDLGPGERRIVKARWPRALVPAAGTHACWLASVLTAVGPARRRRARLGAQQPRAEEPHRGRCHSRPLVDPAVPARSRVALAEARGVAAHSPAAEVGRPRDAGAERHGRLCPWRATGS